MNNLLIIFILVDHRGNDVNLSMVQYYFTDKKHPVDKPPHGNFKSTIPLNVLCPVPLIEQGSWLVRMLQWLHLNR